MVTDILDMLRARLIGELHVGRLRAGDRLPSIRQVSRETGVDHRTVARAYQALSDEGLVEIRGRSGVVVAEQQRVGPVLEGTARWLADVAVEGWLRRIPPPDAAGLLDRALRPGVRALCVESTEDHEVALTAELEEFGLIVTTHRLNAAVRRSDVHHDLASAIRSVDLVVTTVFDAAAVQDAVTSSNTPMVIAEVNPLLREEIARLLDVGGITVVVADPEYVRRARHYMRGYVEGEHYELVLWHTAAARQAARRPESALITRAARRRLGMPDYHFLPRAAPFIARETARQISELIVRHNLRRD